MADLFDNTVIRRLVRLAVLGVSLAALQACDSPCKDLEKKVCEDPKYLKANKKHCELMSEPDRRDNLPKDACKGILDSLSKR